MMKRRIITFLLATVLLFASFLMSANAAFTATLDDIKNQIDNAGDKKADIAAQLKSVENQLKQKQNEYDNTSKEYAALARQYESQTSDLEKQIADLEEVFDEIENLKKTIAESEQAYQDALELFHKRTVVIYKYSNYNSLQLFIESGSLFEYADRVRLLKDMLESDRDTMEELTIMKQDLDAKKALVEITSADLEKAIAEKQIVVNKLKNSQNILESDLTASRSAIAKLQAQEDALEEESKKIGNQIKSLQSQYDKILAEQQKAQSGGQSGTSNGKLNFLWPAPSGYRISSYYGYRTHPITGKWKMHSGVDIPAPGGSNILASEDGVVMTATWNDSYGYYVVIYHGNGYSTLYAHSKKLLVKVGDNVKRGQVIALVGTTGSSTGNHVHFEVRIDGNTKNPLDYISIPK